MAPTKYNGTDAPLVESDGMGGFAPVVSTTGGGGGSGTQYTEGDIDATITGTAAMWEDASNTLRAVSAAYPMPMQQAAVNHYVSLASSDATPITTATGTTVVAAPGAGFKLVILYIAASNSSATGTDVSWRDDTAGTQRYRATLAQNAAFAHNIKPDAWRLTENKPLVLTTSAAGSVHWTVEYVTEAV